jgi:hypothetical protein
MGIEYKQSSFLGGMVQKFDPTKVASLGDSYYLGINVRNREDNLAPIRSPLDLSNSVPEGKKQGIFGSGRFLILFIDGKPYARDVSKEGSSFFALHADAISPDVDRIFLEFVPGSTLGFGRIRAENSDDVTLDVNQEIPFISSQQGAIYQDGINQARLILDNTIDVTKTQSFPEWTTATREYVPLMKQMLYNSGILYGISPDGKQVYHSVSGRPIDFMVVIDQEGDKVGDEANGGAPAVSKRVDFEVITAIKTAPSQNTLIITTANKTFLAQINLINLQFGEPTLDTIQIAAAGAVNQYCFADLNGDTAIISQRGLFSFNAAGILRYQSNNDPFSGVINRLFTLSDDLYVTQDFPCCYEFGSDYVFFAVNTIYGRGVLIYDKIESKFVSLDIYKGVEQIKQFADVVIEGRRRVFFITTDDKLYEAFAGPTLETSGLLIGEWCSMDPKIEQTPMAVRLVFTECEQEGDVFITPIVDRETFGRKREKIKKNSEPKTLPISVPLGTTQKRAVQNVKFNLYGTVSGGWKLGIFIEWNVKAKLTHVSLTAETQTQEVSQNSKSTRFVDVSKAV